MNPKVLSSKNVVISFTLSPYYNERHALSLFLILHRSKEVCVCSKIYTVNLLPGQYISTVCYLNIMVNNQ